MHAGLHSEQNLCSPTRNKSPSRVPPSFPSSLRSDAPFQRGKRAASFIVAALCQRRPPHTFRRRRSQTDATGDGISFAATHLQAGLKVRNVIARAEGPGTMTPECFKACRAETRAGVFRHEVVSPFQDLRISSFKPGALPRAITSRAFSPLKLIATPLLPELGFGSGGVLQTCRTAGA